LPRPSEPRNLLHNTIYGCTSTHREYLSTPVTDSRCSQSCRLPSQVLPGAPKDLSGASRCSQTYHYLAHGTPVLVIRDLSNSECRAECPPRVWYTLDINTSKFTLHILLDTSGGYQWLRYILQMNCQLLWNDTLCNLFQECVRYLGGSYCIAHWL
jgi:hypothetical protein